MPPLASSKYPTRRLSAPVKEPRSWPKSSLSISVGEIGAAVERDERLPARRDSRWIVFADDFLAGAARAGDQDRGVRARDAPEHVEDLLHRLGAADQLARAGRSLQLATQRVDLRLEPPPRREALEDDLELRRRAAASAGSPTTPARSASMALSTRGLAGDDDAVAIRVRFAGEPEDLDAVAVGQVMSTSSTSGWNSSSASRPRRRFRRRGSGLRTRGWRGPGPARRDVVFDDEDFQRRLPGVIAPFEPGRRSAFYHVHVRGDEPTRKSP